MAKHGNRAASSKSGAADVLEALGVKITIDPAKSAEVLKKIGLCFLFAQNYHLSMKYVAPVRKELGIRTIFNILGPLTNPAGANMELMGVYDEALVEPLARVLANLGVKKAMVVYGQDGLDEISMSAPTTVCEVKDGEFFILCDHSGAVRLYPLQQRRADRRKPPGQRADCTGDFKRGKRTQTGCGRSELRSGNPYRKGHFNRRCDQRSAGSHRQR